VEDSNPVESQGGNLKGNLMVAEKGGGERERDQILVGVGYGKGRAPKGFFYSGGACLQGSMDGRQRSVNLASSGGNEG